MAHERGKALALALTKGNEPVSGHAVGPPRDNTALGYEA